MIEKNIRRYKKDLQQYRIGSAEYAELLQRNLRFLEQTEPDHVEELYGIAEGSGHSFDDILIINIPLYFILHWLPQECSSILARGAATLDGRTYLIKNRDYGGKRVEHVILQRSYPDGRHIVEVNGAGMITFPGNGLNSHGLAISTSGVWSRQMSFNLDEVDRAHALLNAHHILRKCATVQEAEDYLRDVPRMSGMNFIVADRTRAAAMEVTKDQLFVFESPDNNLLVRTNHYLHPELAHYNRDKEKYISSYSRYEKAIRYLEQKHGSLRFQDMLELASDHENAPNNSMSPCCQWRRGRDDL